MVFFRQFSSNSSALKVAIYFYLLVQKVNYMLLVDDRLINEIVNAPIEINLMPISLALLFLTVGCGLAYLKWGVKHE